MILLYYIIFGLLWLFTLLPFFIIYRFSDLLFLLLFYIVRYRRKVVQNNLLNAFPNKTKKERACIEKEFYKHFCDYFFETIKVLNVSDKQMRARMKYINPEIMTEAFKNDNSIIGYLGHYGNWEWLSHGWAAQNTQNVTYDIYGAYYPLGNKYVERFFFYLRSKGKSIPVPQKKVLRTIIKLHQEGKKGLFVFIADQSPIWNSVQHWMKFLNQDTATIVGAEKLAKQTGYPSYYFNIKKVSRGHYTCEFIKIADNPKEYKDFEITEKYMRLLEKSIVENPPYWLWTHRRWKFNKDTFYTIYPVKPTENTNH